MPETLHNYFLLKALDCPIIRQGAEDRTPEAVTFFVEEQTGGKPSSDFLASIEAFQENNAVGMICCCVQYPLETYTVSNLLLYLKITVSLKVKNNLIIQINIQSG